jgi:hypothetical protein
MEGFERGGDSPTSDGESYIESVSQRVSTASQASHKKPKAGYAPVPTVSGGSSHGGGGRTSVSLRDTDGLQLTRVDTRTKVSPGKANVPGQEYGSAKSSGAVHSVLHTNRS